MLHAIPSYVLPDNLKDLDLDAFRSWLKSTGNTNSASLTNLINDPSDEAMRVMIEDEHQNVHYFCGGDTVFANSTGTMRGRPCS